VVAPKKTNVAFAGRCTLSFSEYFPSSYNTILDLFASILREISDSQSFRQQYGNYHNVDIDVRP